MSTLQENQSLNLEYERNKKEREMKEEIERLNNLLNQADTKNLEIIEEIIKLEDRIDKAIEYINTMPLTKGTEWYRTQLLNILKGVDKE